MKYPKEALERHISVCPAKLSDVARRAGVGNATASRALNGGANVNSRTLHRILQAAKELEYHPNRAARALKGGASGMIGMVVPSVSDPFFAGCAEAVEKMAVANGCVLAVLATHDLDAAIWQAVKQLSLHNVDGLILGLSGILSEEGKAVLKALRVPTVGIDAPLTGAELPSVIVDNVSGAKAATEHLLSHDFDEVIFAQVKPKLFTMRERFDGYKAAMAAAGKELRTETIHDRESAAAMLDRYRKPGRSFAVFSSNGLTTKLLVQAAKTTAMSMPRDFGMLCFDDFEMAELLAPAMSVVRQPVPLIGHTAADLLFRRIRGDANDGVTSKHLEISLQVELLLRGSCGCGSSGA